MRVSPTNAGTKSIFAEILSEIYLEKSLHDLKHVVKIMHHFFQTRHGRVEMMMARAASPVQLDIQRRDGRVVREKLSLSGEVLIRDKFNSSLVKMQCPDMQTLRAHSSRLAMIMEVSMLLI